MIISSSCIVKYKLYGNLNIITPSNIVKTIIVNPIINFYKNYCGNKVIINIINNSGIRVYNLFLKNVSNETFIKGSLIINGKNYPDADCIDVIKIGTIKNNEKIAIEYQIDLNKKANINALICYTMIIDSSPNIIYLISNIN